MATDAPTLRNELAQKRIEALGEDIERRIEQLETDMLSGHSQAFLQALDWWGQFHRYSFSNSMLIRMQRPTATVVAGIKKWNSLGYTIRAGEKAIWIRAPWIRNEVDEATGEITGKRMIGHVPVYVFDITQTNEFEEKGVPEEFAAPIGDLDWEAIYQGYVSRVLRYGIDVEEADLGAAYGMALKTRIKINRRHDAAQKVSSLIHELAHVLARHHEAPTQDRRQQEMEAESVAYVVCRMIGAEAPGSKDYLLNHRIEPGELKANLDQIGKVVRDVTAVLGMGGDHASRSHVETHRGGRDRGRPVQEVDAPIDRPAVHLIRSGSSQDAGRIPAFRAESI
jgi:hypothetical protein